MQKVEKSRSNDGALDHANPRPAAQEKVPQFLPIAASERGRVEEKIAIVISVVESERSVLVL